MKFFKYKQVCRLNFCGIDDELNNIASSYYNTSAILPPKVEFDVTHAISIRMSTL